MTLMEAADLMERLQLGLAQRFGDLGDELAGGWLCVFAHTSIIGVEWGCVKRK